MSLHSLGIAHSPVVHHHFPSPPARESRIPTQYQHLEQNKDDLVQRLHDLAFRLSTADDLEDSDVAILHSDIDQMEHTLHISVKSREKLVSPTATEHTDSELAWAGATCEISHSPIPYGRCRSFVDTPRNTQSSQSLANDSSSSHAGLIADRAHELSMNLIHAVTRFQTRKEESNVSA